MAINYPVNPRVRAYGKARIDLARRLKTPQDWSRLWVQPTHPFPFAWGGSWKQAVEYKVDDFAAEVGFFIDILGLEVNIFVPGYAMFTSPQGDFFFSVVPAEGLGSSTPPDALRLQFMVADINALSRDLEARGIVFDYSPQPVQAGSNLLVGSFRTPHGIFIDLFGLVESTNQVTTGDHLTEQGEPNDSTRPTIQSGISDDLGPILEKPELPRLIEPDDFIIYDDQPHLADNNGFNSHVWDVPS